MNASITRAIALAAVLVVVACTKASSTKSTAPAIAMFEEESDIEARPARPVASYSKLRTAYLASVWTESNQYYTFGRFYDADDPARLAIYNGPTFQTQGNLKEPRTTESFDFSASFEIVAVWAQTKDHYYVAGRDGTDDIVERWKRAFVSSEPGVPGTYVMKRKQLFRGSLGGIKNIAADHLVRFVLLVHGDSPTKLSKILLPEGGTPLLLYSSTQVPALNMRAESLFPRKHATYGIVWTVFHSIPKPSGEHNAILLYDAEDDGVIETCSVLTADDYFTSLPTSSALWEDWFMKD